MPTKIEWTRGDDGSPGETWNPVTGCTKVSPGCAHCYAERVFPRAYGARRFDDVRCHDDRLERPLHWRKPRRVFVNSMSDLFHEAVPDEFIDRVFAVMALCSQHTFQVLTKRSARMREYFRIMAGLQEDTYYPRLAICRADASRCTLRLDENGGAIFGADRSWTHWRRNSRAHFVHLPRETFPRFRGSWAVHSTRPQGWIPHASALIPIVPAGLHPRAHLRNYHILWDAVWEPAPPVDPLLLRHLAGHLYAIVAAWQLTPLEQAVLRGRL